MTVEAHYHNNSIDLPPTLDTQSRIYEPNWLLLFYQLIQCGHHQFNQQNNK